MSSYRLTGYTSQTPYWESLFYIVDLDVDTIANVNNPSATIGPSQCNRMLCLRDCFSICINARFSKGYVKAAGLVSTFLNTNRGAALWTMCAHMGKQVPWDCKYAIWDKVWICNVFSKHYLFYFIHCACFSRWCSVNVLGINPIHIKTVEMFLKLDFLWIKT